uniref:R-spondin 1 n=1 Tax=Bubo bubo TaxID=30461 RepID=A0A8C0EHJ6_BUBBB
MQLGLFVVVVFLSSMDLTGSSKVVKGKRQRRSMYEMLFFSTSSRDAVQRAGQSQGCPAMSTALSLWTCHKCKIENCESCFSRNFCTKCKEGLYLHKGRCYVTCPEGYSAANGTMECSSPAQCEMSEWGPWGPCSKKRKLCGFKKGNEDRTRRILQAPSGDVSLCPATTEVRRCTVQKSQCPEGKKKKKEEQGKEDNAHGNRNQKDTKDAKSGTKKRKSKQRGAAVPATSASPAQ